MRFGPVQKRFFGATDGGFSLVTPREVRDSQITLTDAEQELAERYFGAANILRGGRHVDPAKALKSFRMYGDGSRLNLNLLYPKPARNELRIYLSGQFKPAAGEVWFIFEKTGELWVGSLPQETWDGIGAADAQDEEYVSMVSGESKPVKIVHRSAGSTYARDPNLGIQRIKMAGYKCEINGAHMLFPSRATGKSFFRSSSPNSNVIPE